METIVLSSTHRLAEKASKKLHVAYKKASPDATMANVSAAEEVVRGVPSAVDPVGIRFVPLSSGSVQGFELRHIASASGGVKVSECERLLAKLFYEFFQSFSSLW
jgi:hypothetical protein